MGRFAEDQGMVWYFAPDTLEWESLEMKYPYLWAKECNIETASKTVVPLSEILRMNDDFSKKLGY